MKWFWSKGEPARAPNTRATTTPPESETAISPPQGEVADPNTMVMTMAIATELTIAEGGFSEEEARQLRNFVIESAREALGRSPLTLTAQARQLKATGHHAEAEIVYKLIVTVASDLGDTNPQYAAAVGNLGVLYDEVGRHADAEPLYLRSLELFRKSPLGERNPPYAQTMQRLGELYEVAGRVAEAKECYLQVAALRRPAP